VLKKGSLLYSGSVEDVSAGIVQVEVQSEAAELQEALNSYEGAAKLERELHGWTVTLAEGQSAAELNRYLFENGIVASHLVTKRKSLEKQFLELLAESDNA
jgi:ABC-2 type transport system ATP-binding protein